MKCFITVILFAIAAASRLPTKLPDYVKPCRAKDSSCLKNLLKELGPRFVLGIPEFNLPSIDPFDVPNFNQSDSHSSQLSYFATVTDMKYEGLSNFNVLKFDIDLDHSKFELKLTFPQVVITTNKVVSGVGFGISVNGSGITKASFSNLTITFSLNAKENSRIEEKVYLKWKEEAITVSFDQVVFEVDASFIDRKNYKRIVDIGNEKYPQVLYPQLKQSIKNTFGAFVVERINFVHEVYPVDVLYLI